MQLEPLGYVKSPYLTKFGVPRQPGLATAVRSHIKIEPGYRNMAAVLGLRVSDWIIVLWSFSHNAGRGQSWSKTVRPPILGGTQRQGVFATRSSFRPNALAISCVQVAAISDDAITVTGGDMVDGTPVFDVFLYDGELDSIPNARGGWAQDASWSMMERVEISDELLARVPEPMREGLMEVLMQDPRPAYTRSGQEQREFWTAFGESVVRFTVAGRVLHVTSVETMDDEQLEELRKTGNITR